MAERTQEFLQFCSVISNGESIIRKPRPVSSDVKTKNAFNEAASDIAKGIHKTSTLLTKLTNLIKRQGLFDDPTDEINSLVFRIKQDLDELNTKCDSAQQFIESKKTMFGSSTDANQSSKHNVSVVSNLKADLMHTTKDFKVVLEMRQKKMKNQQDRKQELTGKGLLSTHLLMDSSLNSNSKEPGTAKSSIPNGADVYSSGASKSASSALVKRNAPNNFYPSPYANESTSSYAASQDVELQSEQSLLLKPIDSKYFDQREQAVTEVEKTIGECGLVRCIAISNLLVYS